MKQFCIGLLLLMSYAGHSQIENMLRLEGDTLFHFEGVESQKPVLKLVEIDTAKRNAFRDHWSTMTFNPFKKQGVQYPFKLAFEDSVFASPVKRKKVVTSHYGWRRGKPHRGIDIDLVTGEKVYAMLDGKVRYVKYVHGHGRVVVIRHSNGLETIYSHLSRQLVKANDIVKKGQVIGRGGTSGNTRGSHLHLVVSYKGVFMNPEYLFEFNEENKIRGKEVWVTQKWTTPYLHTSRRKSNIDLCVTYEQAKESEKNQKKIYVVKRGDTLSKISYKYNVSIARLCKTNSIRRSSVLKVGQKLILSK